MERPLTASVATSLNEYAPICELSVVPIEMLSIGESVIHPGTIIALMAISLKLKGPTAQPAGDES